MGWIIHLWSIIDAALYKGETAWDDGYRREHYRDRSDYRRVY